MRATASCCRLASPAGARAGRGIPSSSEPTRTRINCPIPLNVMHPGPYTAAHAPSLLLSTESKTSVGTAWVWVRPITRSVRASAAASAQSCPHRPPLLAVDGAVERGMCTGQGNTTVAGSNLLPIHLQHRSPALLPSQTGHCGAEHQQQLRALQPACMVKGGDQKGVNPG